MRLAEQKLWDSLRRNAPKAVWLQRIENSVGVGMPDVYCAAFQLPPSNGCSWIELKAPKLPKRPTTMLLGAAGLSAQQIGWHLKADSLGVRSYILVRDDQKNLYLVHGQKAQQINSLSATGLREISIAGSWTEIFEELQE